MVLGAAEALHALAGRAAARIDVLGDRRRADEADGLDVGIVEDGVDRLLVAVDDVEDAGRQAGLDQQLGQHQRHAGVALGRLQDEGVAAGDGGRELPHRDHGREVERRDAGDDAERLAHRIDVDAGAGAVGVLALHQMRDAAGELDHLEAALDVALGVGDGLAVLAGEDSRPACRMSRSTSSTNFISTRARRCGLVAAQAGCAALAFSTAARTSALEASGTLARDRAVHRLEDVAEAARRALDVLAADEMRELCRHA